MVQVTNLLCGSPPMTITIVTAIFDYAFDGVLVGVAYLVLSRRLKLSNSPFRDFAVLVGIFAVLDLLWIPAISELGMSVSFDNPAVYGILGLENPIRGDDLFGLDLMSVVFWIAQALLARAVASRFSRDDWAAV